VPNPIIGAVDRDKEDLARKRRNNNKGEANYFIAINPSDRPARNPAVQGVFQHPKMLS
jgi:hypothetical protein